MRARLAAVALWAVAAPAAAQPVDPLDAAARPSALAARRLLSGVAAAGDRLVAVGQRGHVLWSDDGGLGWTQAAVPVSTDLTAVCFASPERGWAVGHDGVVLATRDGGRSWARQLDGRALGLPLAETSLLAVWFDDERSGLAVGAFGLVLRTEDGGVTWTRWSERGENPRGLHLHAIRRVAGELYVAGEQGLLLWLDAAAGRFRRLAPGYGGSLFGLAGGARAVLAFGLRGNAVRSVDRGRTWQRVATGVEATLLAAAQLPDGRIALATQDGQLLVSADDGASFRPAGPARALPTSALAPIGGDRLVVVGAAGARVERLR
jgi:photosystem II stability/assembly factor-like uncharacterized protein